jgi:cytochrome c oxidase subunit II
MTLSSVSRPAEPGHATGTRADRHRNPLRRMGAASLLGLLLSATAACGGVETYPQTWVVPQSDFAESLWGLQQMLNVLGVAVAILVFAGLGYIMYKFRYQPGAPEPQQVHGNTRLELIWTLIPALLIAVIAVPTVRVIFETQPEPPEDALVVEAVGWQWWWEFRYPMGADTVVTANEIHIPVGRPIVVKIRAADVVHNFWVPQMGGKRYAIPGRVNSIIFTAREPGVYLGQCAEFCGESHALMKKRLIAHSPEGFEEWLRNEASPAIEPPAMLAAQDSAIVLGRQLTVTSCAACHVIRGTQAEFGRLGPDLTHLARRTTLASGIMDNNATNLAAWIHNPQAIKPGALMPAMGLSDQEVQYIVAYLQTLY